MKKYFILFLIALNSLTVQSQCEIDPYIQDNYITDAWIMVFRNFVDDPSHPDYQIPILNSDKTTPYLEKLSAVYEYAQTNAVADSLFNEFVIHANPRFPKWVSFSQISFFVDENVGWIMDFIDTGVSGVPELDQLVQDYDFSITEVAIVDPNAVYIIWMESSIEYLNTYALVDDFTAIDDLMNVEVGIPDTAHNYIGVPYQIDGEEVRASNITSNNDVMLFTLHTECSWFACPDSKAWEVIISEDCSQVTIELLNTPEINRSAYVLYPNPVSEQLYITDIHSEIESIQIYSLEGKLIKTEKLNNEELDVSSLQNGIYFIEINTSEGLKQVQRFIKN